MPESAQAVITKHHRLGGLNNKNVFLTVMEEKQFKIKVLVSSVSVMGSQAMGEDPLPS